MKKTLLSDRFHVSRKLPLNYNEIKEKEKFIIPEGAFTPSFICELENAYVTPYGIVFKNWQVVKESLYSMFVKHNYYPTFLKKLFLRKVRRLPGANVIAHNAFYDNYYHWSTEALPRIFSVKERARDAALILHEKTPRFVREYAVLMGFDKIVTINDDELGLAEKLILPMHTATGLHHNETLVREMTSWLKAKVNRDRPDFSTYKNIYVSRERAAYRKILNEAAVIEVIKKHDFKVVHLEDYSVAEQISLMSNVRNFVAVHGAGVTNIMYMPEKGLVIELIHENHYDPAFYNLASALNHDTVFIQGLAAHQDERGVAWDNFTVDISRLEYFLVNHMRS